jgi:hypothetical protein
MANNLRSLPITSSFDICRFPPAYPLSTPALFFNINMSYARWDEDLDREDKDTWSRLNLLEFIRPAILAMLFFMMLADGMRQPELIIHVLNGQARFMVCLSSIVFFLFRKYFVLRVLIICA